MKPLVLAAALVFLLSPLARGQSKSSTQSTTSGTDKSEATATATASATPSPEALRAPETTTNSTSSAKPNANTGKSGIVLPPEKARPVKLPLFGKPPLIDGKLDDDVWKNAAVLKDFYQVSSITSVGFEGAMLSPG